MFYFKFLGAVELIYNLSIDKTMEEKVVRKGIIKLLCLLLDRTSTDLLLMTIKLLIQLSVYKEHVDKMASLTFSKLFIIFYIFCEFQIYVCVNCQLYLLRVLLLIT